VAEDRSKKGHPKLPEMSLEVWKNGLYIVVGPTMPPHLYLLVLLSGRAIVEEIWRFWEIEAVDSGSTSFRLVVVSSCIELGFLFLGRACTEGRTGGFVGVGPPVHGRSRNLCMGACL
jgi:hypothetical protein